jgi:hypothetical protein
LLKRDPLAGFLGASAGAATCRARRKRANGSLLTCVLVLKEGHKDSLHRHRFQRAEGCAGHGRARSEIKKYFTAPSAA